MAINYPTSLDNFTNPQPSDTLDSVAAPHATQHSDLNDAVEALQAKVGADSSAVTSSLDYKIGDHASRLTAVEGDVTTLEGDVTTLQGDVTTLQGGSFSSLNVDSGTLYVNPTNNRIGIGTTSPVSVLQLISATTGNTDFRIGSTISITRIASGYSGNGNTTINVANSCVGSHTSRSGLLVLNGGTGSYTSHALYYYIFCRTNSGNSQLTQLGRGFYAFDTATRIQLSLTEASVNNVNMVINQWSTAAGYWYLDYIALGY
jgi:hypothetical protein